MPGMFDYVRTPASREQLANEMTHWQPTNYDRPYLNAAQAMGMLNIPGVSDVAGVYGDLQMYRERPSERGLSNYMLTAAGAIPFVPAVAGTIGRTLRPLRKAPHVIPAIRHRETKAIIDAPYERGGDVSHIDAYFSLPKPRPKFEEYETGYRIGDRFVSRGDFAKELIDDLGISPAEVPNGSYGQRFGGIESISYRNFERFWDKLLPSERTKLYDEIKAFKNRHGELPKSNYGLSGVETDASPYGNAVERKVEGIMERFGIPEEFTDQQFKDVLTRLVW